MNSDKVERTSCIVEIWQEKDETGSSSTDDNFEISPTTKKRH